MDSEKNSRALVLAEPQAPQQQNKKSYWGRMGGAYTTVFRALLFVLPVFVIVFMAICAQAFTRDSIYVFARDVRSVSSFLASDYRDVSYTFEQGERQVLSYRDGVAAVTRNGVEIYSPDGERLLDVPMSLEAPRAAASHKYVLTYDFGKTSFVVTNAYDALYEGKTDFPILFATVADTGHFALVTASDTHLSQVLLYDANFNLIQRFSRSSATTGVAISENGKYVSIGGILTENGLPAGVVDTYRIGAKEPSFSARFGEPVLQVSYTDTQNMVLVFDGALRVMDVDGEVGGEVLLDGAALIDLDVQESGCAMLLCTDAMKDQYRVVLTDESGTVTYDAPFYGVPRAIALGEAHFFLLNGTELLRYDPEDGGYQSKQCAPDAWQIYVTNGKNARVIYDGVAKYVEFD